MSKILLEEIVASVDDAIAAEQGGADRFEVCSALALGGLTPSLGTVRSIKAACSAPAMCMVRPREGGMAYSNGEYQAMLHDIETLLEAGADGLVFGLLTPDAEVDLKRCREFMKVVGENSGGRSVQTCFHRAFDVVADPFLAIDQLADLGVSRILTSGRAPEVVDGLEEIRRYREKADGRIEMMPGGGIDASNLEAVVRQTGCREVHVYMNGPAEDRSVTVNPAIYFGAHLPTTEIEYRVVQKEPVARIRQLLDRL